MPTPSDGADATPAGRRPPVSVVVPARDEAATLPTLLASLVPQLRDGDELLVVDDGSTDGTADVARAGGARVVEALPLPPGWVGKPWACAAGVAAAANPLLVLLDADTRLAPGGLDRLVGQAIAAGDGGLLSVQPFHVVPSAAEQLAAFFNVVGAMGVGAFAAFGAGRPPRGAFGPCLVTTAADLARAGGYAAVRASVVEDVDLARAYERSGQRVRVLGGRGTVAFRMYPGGLRPLVEGFTKNMAGGARAAGPVLAGAVGGWVAACAAPAVLALRLPAVLALAAYVLVAVQLHVHLRRLGTFPAATALLYAVPLAAFVAVCLRSLVRTALAGEVSWKGRSVPTRRAP